MKNTQGWAQPLNARKYHYFRDGVSLCRRWMFLGNDLDDTSDNHSDNCAACRRDKIKENGGVAND